MPEIPVFEYPIISPNHGCALQVQETPRCKAVLPLHWPAARSGRHRKAGKPIEICWRRIGWDVPNILHGLKIELWWQCPNLIYFAQNYQGWLEREKGFPWLSRFSGKWHTFVYPIYPMFKPYPDPSPDPVSGSADAMMIDRSNGTV